MQILVEILKGYSWLILLSFSVGGGVTYLIMRNLLNSAREKFFQLQEQADKEEIEWQTKLEAEHSAFEKACKERDRYSQEREELQQKIEALQKQIAAQATASAAPPTPPPMQVPPPMQPQAPPQAPQANGQHPTPMASQPPPPNVHNISSTEVTQTSTLAANENSVTAPGLPTTAQAPSAATPNVSAKPTLTPDRILQQQKVSEVLAESSSLGPSDLNGNSQFDWARLDDSLLPIVERLRDFEKMISDLNIKSSGIGDLKKDLSSILDISTTLVHRPQLTPADLSQIAVPTSGASHEPQNLHNLNPYAHLGTHMPPTRWLERFGLTRGKDFFEKRGPNNRSSNHPDLLIRLPDEHAVFIDCHTVSLENFNAVWDHAKDKRTVFNEMYKTLETRRMQAHSHTEDEEIAACEMHFVLIPSEMIYLDLVQQHPELVEGISESRVYIISPVHLGFICKFVGMASLQLETKEDIDKILKLGKDLGIRTSKVIEAVDSVGTGLNQTVSAFNDLMRSVDFHLISTVRKIERFNTFDWPKFQGLNEDPLSAATPSRNGSRPTG